MSQTFRILIWSGALLVIILIAAGALAVLRRRLFHASEDRAGGPIPLHELRAMHQRGELDDAEFEQLRRAALAEWGVRPNVDAETRGAGTENLKSDGKSG